MHGGEETAGGSKIGHWRHEESLDGSDDSGERGARAYGGDDNGMGSTTERMMLPEGDWSGGVTVIDGGDEGQHRQLTAVMERRRGGGGRKRKARDAR